MRQLGAPAQGGRAHGDQIVEQEARAVANARLGQRQGLIDLTREQMRHGGRGAGRLPLQGL